MGSRVNDTGRGFLVSPIPRPRERNSGERGNSAADSIRKGGTLKAGSFINQNTLWFLLSMILIIFFEKKVSCTGPGGASGLQIIDRGGIEGGGSEMQPSAARSAAATSRRHLRLSCEQLLIAALN